MATAAQLGQPRTSVNDLLDSVATLSSVITTETQQRAQQMQENTASLEALQAQLTRGADDATIQATISQLQQGNAAVQTRSRVSRTS